jgi:hypothetical protein
MRRGVIVAVFFLLLYILPMNLASSSATPAYVQQPDIVKDFTLSSGENWLTGWTYRQKHNISQTAGADENYTIRFTVHSGEGASSGENVYLNNNMAHANFSDLRFTESDGVTLISYWLDKSSVVEAGSAYCWVRIPNNLSESDQTFYIYYGNPNANDISDGDNTFYFFDDFDDDSIDTYKWNNYFSNGEGNTLEEANGKLHILTADSDNNGEAVHMNQTTYAPITTSYAFHFRADIADSNIYSSIGIYSNATTSPASTLESIARIVTRPDGNDDTFYECDGSSNVGDATFLTSGYERYFIAKDSSGDNYFYANSTAVDVDHDVSYSGYGVPLIFSMRHSTGDGPAELYCDFAFVRSWVPTEPTQTAFSEEQYQSDEYQYVDQLSDLHPPSDIGTHSDFAEEQDYDSNYDTLTEEDIVEIPSEWKYVDSYSDVDWAETGSPEYIDAQDQPTNIITGAHAEVTGWCTFADTSGYPSGSNSFTVNLSIYYYASGDGYTSWELDWTSDGNADDSGDFTHQDSYAWQNTGTIADLDTVAEINQLRVRLTGNKGSGGPDSSYVDAVRIGIAETGTNYELDLEVGWVTADYTQTNEELCIYGGTQGAESLRVDVYSSGWVNVISDLAAGWNNISVSSYLVDATFEIRFTDTTNESVAVDTWEVEAVLLHTWSAGGGASVTIYEVIDLSDTPSTSVNLSTTINELLSISDSIASSVSLVVTIFEQIILSDSVSTGLVYLVTIFEIIGLAATASTTLLARETIFETIGLAATAGTTVSLSTTINELINLAATPETSVALQVTRYEVIGLFESVSSQVTGENQYFVTIYELIDISGTPQTVLDASTTVLETIPLSDTITPFMSVTETLFEILPLSDSVTNAVLSTVTVFESLPLIDSLNDILFGSVTINELIQIQDTVSNSISVVVTIFEVIPIFDTVSITTNPIFTVTIYEVIDIVSVVIPSGVETITTVTDSIFYQLFFSPEMWSYLGPIAVVVVGYFCMKEDKALGVLWFIVECLIIYQYLVLVATTPDYWWHVYILLFGGLFTCVFPLWDKGGG